MAQATQDFRPLRLGVCEPQAVDLALAMAAAGSSVCSGIDVGRSCCSLKFPTTPVPEPGALSCALSFGGWQGLPGPCGLSCWMWVRLRSDPEMEPLFSGRLEALGGCDIKAQPVDQQDPGVWGSGPPGTLSLPRSLSTGPWWQSDHGRGAILGVGMAVEKPEGQEAAERRVWGPPPGRGGAWGSRVPRLSLSA